MNSSGHKKFRTDLFPKFVLVFALFVIGGCDSGIKSDQEERYVFITQPVKVLAGTNAVTEAPPFIGQVISISGKITFAEASTKGKPAIQIDDTVVCGFGERFRVTISNLHQGDTVCVKGLLNFVHSDGVYLKPCVFVNEPPASQK